MNPKVETSHFAKLDEAGVYWGVQTLPLPAPKDAVEVPADCDLAPGRYRWDKVEQRFNVLVVPLTEPGRVGMDAAIAELIRLATERGETSPLLDRFVTEFEASLDGGADGSGT